MLSLEDKLADLVRDAYYHQVNIYRGTRIDPADYLLQCDECGLVDGDHIEDTCKVFFIETFLDDHSQALRKVEAACRRDRAREVRREFDRSLKPTFECCPAHG